MDIATELQKLQQLRQSGAISEDEYERAKARILDGRPESGSSVTGNLFSGDVEAQTGQWGLILHLSMLLNFLIPPCGIIAPILIWQLKKNELPGLDEQGKNAVNWIISAVIYAIVGAILIPVVIGFFILMLLGILSIVFPIIAGIKANGGEAWRYPGAISFLS